MTAKSVLMRPSGLRSGARAPTCFPPTSTPLQITHEWFIYIKWKWRVYYYTVFKNRCYFDVILQYMNLCV